MALTGTLKLNIDVNDKDISSLRTGLSGLESQAKGLGSLFKSVLGANLISSGISSGISAISGSVRGLISELDTGTAAWNNFDSNMRSIKMPEKEIAGAKTEMQDFAAATVYSSLDMSNAFSALAQGAHLPAKEALAVVKGFGAIASSANDPKIAMGGLIDLYNGFGETLNRIDFRQVSTALNGNTAGIEKQIQAVTGSNATWADFMSGSVKVTKAQFQQALSLAGTNKEMLKNASTYKSMGQAMDGLAEGLQNKLQPAFSKLTKYGISALGKLGDFLDKAIDPSKLIQMIDKIGPKIESGISKVFSSIKLEDITAIAGAIWEIVKAAGAIGKGFGAAISDLLKPFSGGAGGIQGIANAISNIAKAVQDIPSGVMEGIAKSIIGIALASKGLSIAISMFNILSGAVKAVKVAIDAISNTTMAVKALKNIAKSSEGVREALKLMSKESKLASAALKGLVIKDSISSIVTKIAASFGKLLAFLAPVGSFIMGIFEAIGAFLGVTAGVAAGIVAAVAVVVAALVWFFGFTETGRRIVKKAWDGIKAAIQSVADWFSSTLVPIFKSGWEIIKSGWDSLVSAAQSIWSSISDAISTAIDYIASIISTVIGTIGDIWSTVWTTVLSVATNVWNGIKAVISPVVSWLISTLGPLFQAIGNLIVSVFKFILAVGQMVWRLLMIAISNSITFISNIISTVLNFIVTTWNTVWTTVYEFLSMTWSAIKSTISSAINAVMGVISTVLSTISGIWTVIWTAISSFLSSVWSAIKSLVSSSINAVLNFIQPVLNVIKSIWETIWSVISDFIGPIWDNIKNVVNTAINAVKNVIDNVLNSIKGVWDKIWNSLSGVVQTVMDTVTGIVKGAAKTIEGIIGGITKLINGIAGAVDKATSFVNKIGKLEFDIQGNFSTVPFTYQSGGQLAYAGYGDFEMTETFSYGSQNISSSSFDKMPKIENKSAQEDNKKREINLYFDTKKVASALVDDITTAQNIKARRK